MSDIDTTADNRVLMVLERESRKVAEAAERVRLVVKAMALRHGVASTESDPIDLHEEVEETL